MTERYPVKLYAINEGYDRDDSHAEALHQMVLAHMLFSLELIVNEPLSPMICQFWQEELQHSLSNVAPNEEVYVLCCREIQDERMPGLLTLVSSKHFKHLYHIG